MNLNEATKALTAKLAEHLSDWTLAPSGSPRLGKLYTDTNAALDSDKRILTHETLDDLYRLFGDAFDSEDVARDPRNPAGTPSKDAAAQRSVHDYLDAANLALLRAGYDGERVRADTLDEITKPLG